MQTYDAALEKFAKEMGYRNAAEFAVEYADSRRPENIAKAAAEFRQDRMRQEEDRLDEIAKRNAPRTTSEAELTELVKRHVDRHGGSEADAYWGRYTERTQIYAKVLPCLRRRASGEAV